MDFSCIKDCSQCCIEREYYPSKKFGLEIIILPRIGISNENSDRPTQIIAYQMMGKEKNGNTCPFLDTETKDRSPHGGFPCRIYQNRPLAGKAYPVI